MNGENREQTPPSPRHSVIVGASGALGRALVDACLADPRGGSVFALTRHPETPLGDARWDAPDRATAHHPDRDIAIGQSLPPRSRPPAGPFWIGTDPTDPQSIAAAADAVRAKTACVHRLIVCTGILHGGATDPELRPEKSLRQLRLANLQRCIAVNAWAPLMTLEAFSPLLRHPDGAVAAALSAMVGSIGDNRLGGWYSYRMSKAALNMGIRSAAIEFGRQRHAPIVVAVHPGTTRSALSAPFAGPERARPAPDSATALLRVLDGLGPDDTGRFFNWDGRELPW